MSPFGAVRCPVTRQQTPRPTHESTAISRCAPERKGRDALAARHDARERAEPDMEVQRRVAVHGLPGENLSFGHGGLQLSNGIIWRSAERLRLRPAIECHSNHPYFMRYSNLCTAAGRIEWRGEPKWI